MKNKIHFTKITSTTIFLTILLLSLPAVAQEEVFTGVEKVKIMATMVVNESGDGDATMMVDEQEMAGDPLNGNYDTPSTSWTTAYNSSYPLAAYIDLGNRRELKHVFIFDVNGVGDVMVEYGEPGNWTHLFTEPLNRYKRWKRHDVEVTSRYLRIVKTKANPKFSEVLIYATAVPDYPQAITNLAAQEVSSEEIELTWTDIIPNASPGTGYDLRYNTLPIDEENFESCSQYPISLVPLPGAGRSLEVAGLDAGTTYYFAIKTAIAQGTTPISNIASAATEVLPAGLEEKMLLSPEMITNESGRGDATLMVDEQEMSGDPLSGNGGTPTTAWLPSYNHSDYPASAYIDLGAVEQISRIFFRDVNSSGDVVVETGSPGNWTYVLTEDCNKYMQWKQHNVSLETRYLRITKMHRESYFSEIVFYRQSPIPLEEKIFIEPAMVSNPSGYGEAWKLADEQEIAGDPANSTGGNPVETWQTGWQSSIPYPLYAILDLGKNIEVTKIFLRDTYDHAEFTIWTGSENDWQLAAVDNLTGFLSWNQHEINTQTRFLRFGKTSPRTNVAELVVYGIDHNPGVGDTIAPAAISDLAASPGSDSVNAVSLSWTAPGDDNLEGLCQGYDIRYSTSPITSENFFEAAGWSFPPEPETAGTVQEQEITGLNPATTYYFAIKAFDENYNFSDLSNDASITTDFEIGGAPFRITLIPDMILNENVFGDVGLLVDEQIIAGDPLFENGGQPETRWNPGSTSWAYPCYAMIDLQGSCFITDVFLYDADGNAPVSVFTGTPFVWNLAFVDSLENTDIWNHHELNQESRYLRLKIESSDTKINEIVIYASRLEEMEEVPEPASAELMPMDQLIGINTFVNDPLGRMMAAGFVREYHNWSWCEGNNDPEYPGYPNNENRFNTLGWNFDYYYQNLKSAGITACPDIQNGARWINQNLLVKPLSANEDAADPFSYAEHADHLFQYAARYGSQAVDESLLKLAEGQAVVSGSDLLNYYEDWNEQDKWWEGGDAYFTPYEYAAMASADYDGHLGAMGNTLGVKNADPNARLVMGGIAKHDLNYVKAIKLWADYYRNGSFPLDVINIHYYCNNGDGLSSGTAGISPEADDLKGLLEGFVDYRNRYLPGKEVWITEFGYDTHPQSVQRAPEIGTFSQQEVQGQWMVRSYLALAAAGVDRAAMYMLRDVNENSSTKYSTSGLVRSKDNDWEPKISWFYTYTLKNRLAGMQFDGEIASGNPNVWIYKFINIENNTAAYAVWCPTSDQTTVDAYELQLDAAGVKALLVELQVGSIGGQASDLAIEQGKILIDVSERPVFVLTAPTAEFQFPEFSPVVKFNLDASMVHNESGYGNPALMVDEQELAGDPHFAPGGSTSTAWSAGYSVSYPLSAYLDLGETHHLEAIYLRDANGSGKVTFSIGEPGNWIEVAEDDLKRYNTWSKHLVGQSSQYLRVTLHHASANFSEILIYVSN